MNTTHSTLVSVVGTASQITLGNYGYQVESTGTQVRPKIA